MKECDKRKGHKSSKLHVIYISCNNIRHPVTKNFTTLQHIYIYIYIYIYIHLLGKAGIAVAQWLRCCATNRKVAGSIPVGVIGIFH